jgi:hypothetical protein
MVFVMLNLGKVIQLAIVIKSSEGIISVEYMDIEATESDDLQCDGLKQCTLSSTIKEVSLIVLMRSYIC